MIGPQSTLNSQDARRIGGTGLPALDVEIKFASDLGWCGGDIPSLSQRQLELRSWRSVVRDEVLLRMESTDALGLPNTTDRTDRNQRNDIPPCCW